MMIINDWYTILKNVIEKSVFFDYRRCDVRVKTEDWCDYLRFFGGKEYAENGWQ